VVITDAQQKVLTTTDLGSGTVVVDAENNKVCEFTFTATDIPVGTTYGIKVGGLGMQVAHPTTAGGLTITFGSSND
jgi:hypothetical protein